MGLSGRARVLHVVSATWLALAVAVCLSACDDAGAAAVAGPTTAQAAGTTGGTTAPVQPGQQPTAGGAAGTGGGAMPVGGAAGAVGASGAGGAQDRDAATQAADAATGASGADAGAGEPDAGEGTPQGVALPPVDATDGPGPFETTQDLRSGPQGQSGLFRPARLGEGGLRHPIFVWGCGGGSTPATYAELMNQVASHGFVVIAETSGIGDQGAPLAAAIDWMIAQDARAGSEFAGKLDTSKIALGGHSIGSANAFLVASDPRLTTSIHVAGGSLDMPGNINAPTTGSGGKGLVHPVAYICSQMDSFGNVEKTELDYQNTSAPAWMTIMTGVDHVAAARRGLPAMIAWLRWQLGGEAERRDAFLDPAGEFSRGMYVSKSKNW